MTRVVKMVAEEDGEVMCSMILPWMFPRDAALMHQVIAVVLLVVVSALRIAIVQVVWMSLADG